MTFTDIIILIVVTLILSTIIFFNFILPRIKKESPCQKCAYAKSCKSKSENNKNCTNNK